VLDQVDANMLMTRYEAKVFSQALHDDSGGTSEGFTTFLKGKSR